MPPRMNTRPPMDARYKFIISWIPLILVTLLAGYSYYAYVITLCLDFLLARSLIQSIIYLVFYHLLLALFALSYLRILSQQPGFAKKVLAAKSSTIQATSNPQTTTLDSEQPNPSISSTDQLAIESPQPMVQTSSMLGTPMVPPTSPEPVTNVYNQFPGNPEMDYNMSLRYCHPCKLYKPDRVHHCSVCNECVLRMDHHCPWIAGCVGYKNHKYFYHFIFYAAFYCMFVFGTALSGLIMAVQSSPQVPVNPNWAVVIALTGIWGLTLTPFTVMHTFQIMTNQTTLEYMKNDGAKRRLKRKERDAKAGGYELPVEELAQGMNEWNVGWYKNWTSVMGVHWWQWFLPVAYLSGTGTEFERNPEYPVVHQQPPSGWSFVPMGGTMPALAPLNQQV